MLYRPLLHIREVKSGNVSKITGFAYLMKYHMKRVCVCLCVCCGWGKFYISWSPQVILIQIVFFSGMEESSPCPVQHRKRDILLYLEIIQPDILLYPVQPKQTYCRWRKRNQRTCHSGNFTLSQCLSLVVICLYSFSCIMAAFFLPSLSSLCDGYSVK